AAPDFRGPRSAQGFAILIGRNEFESHGSNIGAEVERLDVEKVKHAKPLLRGVGEMGTGNRAIACGLRASRKMRREWRARWRTTGRFLLFRRAWWHPLCDCGKSFRRGGGPGAQPRARVLRRRALLPRG